jgi:hypothetical protein
MPIDGKDSSSSVDLIDWSRNPFIDHVEQN